MGRTVKVNCVNSQQELYLPIGISLKEIADQLAGQLPFKPLAARVNNRLEDLNMELYHPKQVEFIGIDDSQGMYAYLSSLIFLVASAFEELYPEGSFQLAHKVVDSFFFSVSTDDANADMEKLCHSLTVRIQQYVDADIHFEPVEEETAVVVEKFRKAGRNDVALLLENYHDLYATYYRMGTHIDYQYGPMVYSTANIDDFELVPCTGGFLLSVAAYSKRGITRTDVLQTKEFGVYSEAVDWNRRMHAGSVGEINASCQQRRGSGWLIKVAEALQEKKISQLAEQIASSGKRIVLIAGPSSSGKTTFSKRLEVALEAIGRGSYPISLDDFFVNRADTPLDENGKPDFESIRSVDLAFLSECMKKLLKGTPVDMPTYNFVAGKREFNDDRRGLVLPDSIFVIEGLHGLNPQLLQGIDHDDAFRIFVSPLTSLSLDDHTRFSANDNRLLRRISRDAVQRGRSAQATLASWPSVRQGELKWILPYQEEADVFFNTALIYELAVIKPYAEDLLREVPQNCAEYAEAQRLLTRLQYILPLSDKEIPPTSIVREFVGGSSFRY